VKNKVGRGSLIKIFQKRKIKEKKNKPHPNFAPQQHPSAVVRVHFPLWTLPSYFVCFPSAEEITWTTGGEEFATSLLILLIKRTSYFQEGRERSALMGAVWDDVWAAVFDLKASFYQVEVPLELRWLFVFSVGGTTNWMKRFPMGFIGSFSFSAIEPSNASH
jgi:hypothetical protein